MPEAPRSSSIQTGPPRLFTLKAVLITYVYGCFLALPVLLAVMLMTVMSADPWSLVLPFAALAISAVILPLGQGNLHIRRIVQSLYPREFQEPDSFVVQLTFAPRLRGGTLAALETADDVGVLIVGERTLRFLGDSVRFELAYDQVRQARPESIGLRGLFVYGRPVALELCQGEDSKVVQIAERTALWLPTSRLITAKMHRLIRERLSQAVLPDPKA
jgi:hypothetical protein